VNRASPGEGASSLESRVLWIEVELQNSTMIAAVPVMATIIGSIFNIWYNVSLVKRC